MLSEGDFKHVVKNSPLFSIDLVVLNEKKQLLFGLRRNEPARGFWFVPGGRVLKDETLDNAFRRITLNEIGKVYEREYFDLLGLYEHFYENSRFDASISTHYINAPYFAFIDSSDLRLPLEQHQEYRWLDISTVKSDDNVHQYSKVFVNELLRKLNKYPKL